MKPYKLNLFKVLNDKQEKELSLVSELECWYLKNDEKVLLKCNKEDNQYSIESSNGDWNIEDHGLGINYMVKLRNASKLFGIDGIAEEDAKISLIITWKSSKSKERGVFELQRLQNEDCEQIFNFEHFFRRNTFHGVIELNVRLVLEQVGTKRYASLNNTQGVIIGEIGKVFINVDGSGSLFPIINICDKEKGLWSVKMEFTDPSQDLFVDCFRIVLNTAHRDYKFIDISNTDKYCSRLISEIIQQSIIVLLTKLYSDGFLENITNIDFQDGSILQVVKYMIDTKEFDVSSIESIVNTVSKYFDNRGVTL